jgi:hypothetical protein
MLGTRRFLKAAQALIVLLGAASMHAAPPLTLIQDVLYKADGTRFEGVAFIQWKGFQAWDQSTIASQSVTVRITNGSLRVQLVPSVSATPPSFYEVRYNSDGRIQFTEYWAVPQSTAALRLSDVRIPGPIAGGIITPPPPVTSPGSVLITDVPGLRSELDVRPAKGVGYVSSRAAMINSSGVIESVLGGASDCVHVDGTSGPCVSGGTGGPVFVDGEAPAGVVNAVNSTFTLSAVPSPSNSLMIYRNGILLSPNADFSITAANVVFGARSIPSPGDTIQAWYRSANSGGAAVAFTDGETPAGLINGSNGTFTLAVTPNPISSLQVFRNGILQRTSVDFSINGPTLTFNTLSIPQPGDTVQTWYRH